MPKKKAYMVLETKEDFDKIFKSGYKCGYELGLNDGRIDVLISINKMLENNFTDEERADAAYEEKRKGIAKWKKEQKEREERERREIEEIEEITHYVIDGA